MIRFILLLLLLQTAHAQAPSSSSVTGPSATQRVQKLYDSAQWNAVLRAVPHAAGEPADLVLYRGLALAQLGRLDAAEHTFRAGFAAYPRDVRFLEELAGIAYRKKRYAVATRALRRALAIDPHDRYADDFLASIYFLHGNLEAALKYWNRTGKPALGDLTYDPSPRIDPLILDRIFAFSPGNVWLRSRYLDSQAELASLDLFPNIFYDLQAQPDGTFQLVVHAAPRSTWREAKIQNLISALRGLPYQSVYPEFYNLNGKALNWRSFVRWDPQKRMLLSELAAPLEHNPGKRVRIYFDGRNENWNITRTLRPIAPAPAGLNLQRGVLGAGVQSIVNWRWQWNANAEYSYRDFRTLVGIPPAASPFFTRASGLAVRSGVHRSLIRNPERRFTFDGGATGELGRFFARPLGKYGRVEGSAEANWFPQATGEDYSTRTRLRAGRTFGQIPFDDLFMLGFDRDNPLWMRGHNGLVDGKKGNAPLGTSFILSNSQVDKIAYQDGIFLLKLGPFVDTGDIYDRSAFFGSPKWLTDTGVQATVRVLGSFEVILGYGKDLRSGANTFYSTVSR